MKNQIKPIPGFPGYLADACGNIYSSKRRNLRALRSRITTRTGDIRRVINIRLDGKDKTVKVATLVLLAFVGPRPDGFFACHGPKGSLVDSLDNLYWANAKTNAADRKRDGTNVAGESHYAHRLTEEDVCFIRENCIPHSRGLGLSQTELGKKYGVYQSTISAILLRKKWKHI